MTAPASSAPSLDAAVAFIRNSVAALADLPPPSPQAKDEVGFAAANDKPLRAYNVMVSYAPGEVTHQHDYEAGRLLTMHARTQLNGPALFAALQALEEHLGIQDPLKEQLRAQKLPPEEKERIRRNSIANQASAIEAEAKAGKTEGTGGRLLTVPLWRRWSFAALDRTPKGMAKGWDILRGKNAKGEVIYYRIGLVPGDDYAMFQGLRTDNQGIKTQTGASYMVVRPGESPWGGKRAERYDDHADFWLRVPLSRISDLAAYFEKDTKNDEAQVFATFLRTRLPAWEAATWAPGVPAAGGVPGDRGGGAGSPGGGGGGTATTATTGTSGTAPAAPPPLPDQINQTFGFRYPVVVTADLTTGAVRIEIPKWWATETGIDKLTTINRDAKGNWGRDISRDVIKEVAEKLIAFTKESFVQDAGKLLARIAQALVVLPAPAGAVVPSGPTAAAGQIENLSWTWDGGPVIHMQFPRIVVANSSYTGRGIYVSEALQNGASLPGAAQIEGGKSWFNPVPVGRIGALVSLLDDERRLREAILGVISKGRGGAATNEAAIDRFVEQAKRLAAGLRPLLPVWEGSEGKTVGIEDKGSAETKGDQGEDLRLGKALLREWKSALNDELDITKLSERAVREVGAVARTTRVQDKAGLLGGGRLWHLSGSTIDFASPLLPNRFDSHYSKGSFDRGTRRYLSDLRYVPALLRALDLHDLPLAMSMRVAIIGALRARNADQFTCDALEKLASSVTLADVPDAELRAGLEREAAKVPGRSLEGQPLRLKDYQKVAVGYLNHSDGRALVADSMGLGKAKVVTEPVRTSAGWQAIGTLTVGDSVIDPDTGFSVPVLGVYPQGERDVFKLETSDPEAYSNCDGEHLWLVLETPGTWASPTERVLTTQAMLDKGLRHANGAPRFSIPAVQGGPPDSRAGVHRAVLAITPAGRAECVCIAVASQRQLFFTRGYLPTHNTPTALAYLRLHPEALPALVVAPTNVVGAWLDRAQEWAPGIPVARLDGVNALQADTEEERRQIRTALKKGISVMGYSVLAANADMLVNAHLKTVVFDEAHYLKIREDKVKFDEKKKEVTIPNASARALAGRRVAHSAEHRILLTGTPIENEATEIYHLLHMLNPAAFPIDGWIKFRNRYSATRGKARQLEYQGEDGQVFTIEDDRVPNRKEILEELREELTCYMIRRTKTEVGAEMNLPTKTRSVLRFDLGSVERANYKAVEDNIDKIVFDAYRRKVAAVAARLVLSGVDPVKAVVQASSVPLSPENAAEARFAVMGYLRRAVGAAKIPRIIEEVKAFFRTRPTDSLVVFVEHSEVAQAVGQALESIGVKYGLLTGSVPGRQRDARVTAFRKGEIQVMVATRAAREGITLIRANTAIFGEQWWVPAWVEQAEDRIYRLGQLRPVNIIRLIANGTIDDDLDAIQARKELEVANVLHVEDVGEGKGGLKGEGDSETDTDDILDGKAAEILGDWIRVRIEKALKASGDLVIPTRDDLVEALAALSATTRWVVWTGGARLPEFRGAVQREVATAIHKVREIEFDRLQRELNRDIALQVRGLAETNLIRVEERARTGTIPADLDDRVRAYWPKIAEAQGKDPQAQGPAATYPRADEGRVPGPEVRGVRSGSQRAAEAMARDAKQREVADRIEHLGYTGVSFPWRM